LSPFHEPLKNIEKQIERGAKLTKQLLGYARKGKYNVRPINLNQIVEESSEAFGRTRKEITIQNELEKNLFTIEADQGQMEQILYNLYVNAADAMPGGGVLVLKTSNVTHADIKSEKYNPVPGNYISLTVMDTGTGMDETIKDRIFEPFFTTKEMDWHRYTVSPKAMMAILKLILKEKPAQPSLFFCLLRGNGCLIPQRLKPT
jgi:signal transduction histidine kinase